MKSGIFNRILIVSLALICLSQSPGWAGEVAKDQALTIAGQIVRQYFPSNLRMQASNISIRQGMPDTDPFYVCNVGGSGYVLVAKSDNFPPILGFSWESDYEGQSAASPQVMKAIFDNIRTKCESYSRVDSVSPAITKSWEALSNTKSGSDLKTGIVSPLLSTTWDTDSSYFELFPKSFKAGGSVPIAMAQVFRYYGRPSAGVEKSCYILNGYGELCTDYKNAKFNFSRMSSTTGNSSVDSLVYYMSVAARLQPEGASLAVYNQTLPLHFGYSSEMGAVEAWNYNLGEVIRFELSLRHPVPAEWLGQAFVIDGYFPENLFHFNMGLGGRFNGFFLLDYPIVKADTEHVLLTCYTNYHPKSTFPDIHDLTGSKEGDNIRLTWNVELTDSVKSLLKRYVVLKDGLIPIAESMEPTILLSRTGLGTSANLRVLADFGNYGSSEMSGAYRYISDERETDIPSLALRQLINTILGSSDLLRQPMLGELELIKDLEITFQDQRGIEKLTELKDLRIDGTRITYLREGDYLQNLKEFIFFKCVEFDFSALNKTRNLQELYGYDFLPVDLYDFRHNTDLGLLVFTTSGTNPNMLMDLYGADKYFPKLADFYVRHLAEGINGAYQDCFVSYESYLDIYPKIKANQNVMAHTKPTDFAPCYPVPAREANLPAVTRLSWQSNFRNQEGVYYNVFLGTSRKSLELVSVFQDLKYYDGTFESNKDYYWRVEAYHADSTYYSGIYHFSTWQDVTMPFTDNFNNYYSACPVVDESPFWSTTDTKLTGKAVANRNTKYEGFYSLEVKPKSEAAVVINTPKDTVYYIEYRILNQGGEIATELLQKSATSSDVVVNSKIEFLGKDLGLFTYGTTSYTFNFLPDQWNRVNIALHLGSGLASLSVNDILVKEWSWRVQIGGATNTNPFKGLRFVNNAAASGSSGFIDNVLIDQKNPASTGEIVNSSIGMIYQRESRQVIFTGIQPSEIRDITLFDMQGRKLMTRLNPDTLTFSFNSQVRNGVYLIVVNRRDGAPYARKLAVLD